MRRALLATAAAAVIVSATGLFAGANALTPSTQSGVREAIDGTNLTDNVRWVCRYDWRGFRRCWWQPTYYRHYGYRPYRYRYY